MPAGESDQDLKTAGMSFCCLSGKVKAGKPTGHVTTIAGLNTYIAEPETESGTKKKSVVFLTDSECSLPSFTEILRIHNFANIRLLADNYAKAGFTSYIPDIHQGDSLPIDFLQDVEPPLPTRESQTIVQKTAATAKVGATLGPWLITHREGVVKPLIDGFIREVRKIPGTEKVGVVGFCWGGRYAIISGKETDPALKVDAVYAAHPSLLSIPADFEGLVAPLSLALGDKDSLLGEKEVGQIKGLLNAKENEGAGTAVESEIRIYKDQVHGFALRGDWSSEKDREALDQAEKQGEEWFEKWLN